MEIYIRRVHKYIRHLPTDCNFCPPKHNKYAPYYNLVAEKYFPQPSTRVYKFHIPRVYRELRTLQVADILLFYISRYQYTTIVVATLASTSSVHRRVSTGISAIIFNALMHAKTRIFWQEKYSIEINMR